MPEAEEPRGPALPASQTVRKRVRRRRHRPILIRYWWVIPLAVFVAVLPAIWNRLFYARASYDPLPGYITDSTRIEEEYRNFSGKLLDSASASQLERAKQLMRDGNYANAALVLEAASKEIPIPAVFNDLGVLYAKLRDGPHSMAAFRDALARDHDYAPVRANLKMLHLPEAIDPEVNEVEPNNDDAQANAIWLDRQVRASIGPSVGDVDCFWFTTPRPPRDRISVTVASQAATLIPRLRIYDQAGNLVTGVKEGASAGSSLRFDFSPPPNTLYYVKVDGASGSSGAYALTVSALRAYDVYEPNDTILTSTRIAPRQSVEANIMDRDDTDYYSFASPVSGSVTVDVVSRGDTLVVGLGMFDADLHNVGFAPSSKAGDSVHQVMKVEANQVYYVQVFSKGETTGAYSLVIK